MSFYVRMAWRSLLRSRGLTLVMIAALSLGIGTWYLQHQIFAFLDGKTPEAPDGLHQVALERVAFEPAPRPGIVAPLIPSILLTRHDAETVVRGLPHRQATTFCAPALAELPGGTETLRVRYTTPDLFPLFDIPFVAGQRWSAAQTDGAVIDEQLARRAFGDPETALGRTLRVDGIELQVIGVVAASHATRYHLYERLVPLLDAVYLPLAHGVHADPDLRYDLAGAEPGFMQVWIELPTDADRAAFLATAPTNLRLRTAAEWRRAFLPGGTINLWPLLSALCLVTSIVNLVRMLIAKFAGRGHDLGLLRAFGARRREVMAQLLLEALLIGLLAGGLGILLGIAMMPIAMGTIEHISGTPTTISANAVIVTLGASIGISLLAALYPAWQLSRGTPAVQLRGRR